MLSLPNTPINILDSMRGHLRVNTRDVLHSIINMLSFRHRYPLQGSDRRKNSKHSGLTNCVSDVRMIFIFQTNWNFFDYCKLDGLETFGNQMKKLALYAHAHVLRVLCIIVTQRVIG